jgi:hypothetical protein
MYSQFSIYIIKQRKTKCQFGNKGRQVVAERTKMGRDVPPWLRSLRAH